MGVRVGAVVALIAGLAGLLYWWWVIAFLTGPRDELMIERCGTRQEMLGEVAERPGTWCKVRGENEGVETYGAPRGDRAYTRTMGVVRTDNGYLTRVYAPQPYHFGLAVLSTGLAVGGVAGLLTARRLEPRPSPPA